MKLTDLEPQWLDYSIVHRTGIGMDFLCPACLPLGRRHRITVYFINPLDGKGRSVHPTIDGYYHWQRTGADFETMTLSPSINDVGHWHGWVRNGQVTTV